MMGQAAGVFFILLGAVLIHIASADTQLSKAKSVPDAVSRIWDDLIASAQGNLTYTEKS